MRLHTIEQCPLAVPVRKGFRGGSIAFRDLMTGTPGTPGNYGLQMVAIEDEYHTPQHRHNFEQVRVMLEGSFGFGPGLVQQEGSVGYFCEGTYYTQKGDGHSITLLLQMGGPSGQGFMTRAQLRQGIDDLSQRGSFNDGVYTWHDETGKKHNQDSYEAVWEHVNARPMRYAKPQYLGPVLMEPQRFAWHTLAPGVRQKSLGRFNSHGLTLSLLQLDGGAACTPQTTEQPQLMFCIRGQGQLGTQAYGGWSSAELERNESANLQAHVESEFFVFGLPLYPL